MPMPMQQDEMAEMQSKAGKDNSGGVSKLAQELADKLSQFKDLIDNSESTTDKDRMQMEQLMNLYVSLVENQLGSAPGEDQEEMTEEMPQVPMQAGLNGKPMGPQSRQ